MAQTFKLACVVVLACYVIMSLEDGTTPDIKKMFKERCLNYTLTRPDLLPLDYTDMPNVTCDDLWRNFSSVWKYKSSCGDHNFTYDRLFQHLAQKLPRDKLLFWSGTGTLAHTLSDKGRLYMTLEDTFIGSVADRLTWCGNRSGDGINYATCPAYNACDAQPVKNFWQAASKWFASQAAGEISVLLNGSNPSGKAYRNDSIFSSVEVPGLESSAVEKLTAIVVQDVGKADLENCSTQSLLALESYVKSKNIRFDCHEIPRSKVKLLLCLHNTPHDPKCTQQNSAMVIGHFAYGSSMWARLTSATAMATLLMISFMCM